MSAYFHDIYSTLRTILIGMRVTLRYCFAKTITVQYPDIAPTLQPRFRGFHWYEIEKCIACDQCAKACPVDCIYIEKTAVRKIDKTTGVAVGGAMVRYAIDYAKCMFCGLCIPPCPTDCIHMGNIHDLSGYDRESMVVEFTELAKEGLRTPQPHWMRSANRQIQFGSVEDRLPEWVVRTRQVLEERDRPHQEKMLKALTEQKPPEKAKAAQPAGEASAATATAEGQPAMGKKKAAPPNEAAE